MIIIYLYQIPDQIVDFKRIVRFLIVLAFLYSLTGFPPMGGMRGAAQNIGISTDATAPETGLMLDIKAPSGYAKNANNSAQPFFQIKSFDADADALKLRMGLRTDATQSNRYGFMEFLEAGTPTYLPLALQPSGGNVGIGTASPGAKLEIQGTVKIVDGTQGAGKALISDGAGLASWNSSNIVNVVPADDFGTNSTTYVLRTGASVSITITSGKVLLMVSAQFGTGDNDEVRCRINRDSGTEYRNLGGNYIVNGSTPFSFTTLFTGLSAGTHTFTLEMRSVYGDMIYSNVSSESDRYKFEMIAIEPR